MRDVPITNRQVWWLAFEAALAGAASSDIVGRAVVKNAMGIADEAVKLYRDAEVNK